MSSFTLHIAVDFGTDGLGIAYAVGNSVFVHSEFKGKKFGATVKPKTIILLDDEGEPNAFGMDAKFTYMNLKQKDKWMLFERFKMCLFEEEIENYHKNDEKKDNDDNNNDELRQINKVNIKDELTALNGKTYASEKVFIAAFKHIEKEALKFLRKKKIKPKKHEIQWILTVPAIWDDKAKYKMKQWIIGAGLVDKNIDNQCKIVYEPDCASLAIQYFIKQNTFNNNSNNEQKQDNTGYDDLDQNEFKKGEKYILVDSGGGTSDIACHEILGEFGVKEIWHPSGGPWGSCYIDDQYIKLLEQIFSKQWIDEFKQLYPNLYVELTHDFQKAKATFFTKRKSHKHNCRLPEDFVSFIEEKLDEKGDDDIDEVDKMVKKAKILNKNHLVALNDEFLEISVLVWESLFDHVINPTIEHVKDLLKKPRMIRNCKYLCLVGGLSCSLYFQYKMEQAFGPKSNYRMQLIIPKRPILSVVQGAAYFAITNEYIKARRLRKTYGYVISISQEDAQNRGVSQQQIETNKYFDPYMQMYRVNGFHIVARKNEQISSSDIKVNPAVRQTLTTLKISIRICCSDIENPLVQSDTTELAILFLEWKDTDTDLYVITEFDFHDTLIQVQVYKKSTPNDKKKVSLEYKA